MLTSLMIRAVPQVYWTERAYRITYHRRRNEAGAGNRDHEVDLRDEADRPALGFRRSHELADSANEATDGAVMGGEPAFMLIEAAGKVAV
jgi:hypothetical protein